MAKLSLFQVTANLKVVSAPGFAYFTMAIFSNTFGLSDQRKPEFMLTVTVIEDGADSASLKLQSAEQLLQPLVQN